MPLDYLLRFLHHPRIAALESLHLVSSYSAMLASHVHQLRHLRELTMSILDSNSPTDTDDGCACFWRSAHTMVHLQSLITQYSPAAAGFAVPPNLTSLHLYSTPVPMYAATIPLLHGLIPFFAPASSTLTSLRMDVDPIRTADTIATVSKNARALFADMARWTQLKSVSIGFPSYEWLFAHSKPSCMIWLHAVWPLLLHNASSLHLTSASFYQGTLVDVALHRKSDLPPPSAAELIPTLTPEELTSFQSNDASLCLNSTARSLRCLPQDALTAINIKLSYLATSSPVEVWRALSQMPKLETLSLREVHIVDAGCDALIAQCHSLTSMHLSGEICLASTSAVFAGLPRLRSFNLTPNANTTHTAFAIGVLASKTINTFIFCVTLDKMRDLLSTLLCEKSEEIQQRSSVNGYRPAHWLDIMETAKQENAKSKKSCIVQ